MTIRPAELADVPGYAAHLARHGAESGRDGDLIFTPMAHAPVEEELLRDCRARWSRAPAVDVGWERVWLLFDEAGAVRGALVLLQQPPLPPSVHRATLMMGLERSHRRQGWGEKMVATALAWARATSGLAWIDLNVFSHNAAAQTLYAKFGFAKTGETRDLFRVEGTSIDDVHMALRV